MATTECEACGEFTSKFVVLDGGQALCMRCYQEFVARQNITTSPPPETIGENRIQSLAQAASGFHPSVQSRPISLPSANKSNSHAVAIVVTLVISIFVVVILIAMVTAPPPDPAQKEQDQLRYQALMAEGMAKKFVIQKLKAPSTAKFPGLLEPPHTVHLGGKRFQVSSWVDAQNSFGAMMRNKYVVDLEKQPDGTWIAHSVVISLR